MKAYGYRGEDDDEGRREKGRCGCKLGKEIMETCLSIGITASFMGMNGGIRVRGLLSCELVWSEVGRNNVMEAK